jgi:Flp pilus assembly protein TadG
MVEFALIRIPLLILVVGIIQFGIGLNYWLDMNRLANQGARWAVVNAWPDCPRNQVGTCNGSTVGAGNSLPTYLKSQAVTRGLQSSVTVSVCYPPTNDPDIPVGTTGAPVRVTLASPYKFRLIMKLPTINLQARATMRLEQDPTHIVAGTC